MQGPARRVSEDGDPHLAFCVLLLVDRGRTALEQVLLLRQVAAALPAPVRVPAGPGLHRGSKCLPGYVLVHEARRQLGVEGQHLALVGGDERDVRAVAGRDVHRMRRVPDRRHHPADEDAALAPDVEGRSHPDVPDLEVEFGLPGWDGVPISSTSSFMADGGTMTGRWEDSNARRDTRMERYENVAAPSAIVTASAGAASTIQSITSRSYSTCPPEPRRARWTIAFA